MPTPDKVRELQRAFYRAAKQNPERLFHALHDKVYRWDILLRAWERVKENNGAPGVDGETLKHIADAGVIPFLADIQQTLQEGEYFPMPVRFSAIRDRIVQMAIKIVIWTIFEADFRDCSFGFRPKRSAHQAVQAIRGAMWRSTWVIDTDIVGFFDNIDHRILMERVRRPNIWSA